MSHNVRLASIDISPYIFTGSNLFQSLIPIQVSSVRRSFFDYRCLISMDLFDELEIMATNASKGLGVEFEPDEDEITRRQRLFASTYSEAMEQIRSQKKRLPSAPSIRRSLRLGQNTNGGSRMFPGGI